MSSKKLGLMMGMASLIASASEVSNSKYGMNHRKSSDDDYNKPQILGEEDKFKIKFNQNIKNGLKCFRVEFNGTKPSIMFAMNEKVLRKKVLKRYNTNEIKSLKQITEFSEISNNIMTP